MHGGSMTAAWIQRRRPEQDGNTNRIAVSRASPPPGLVGKSDARCPYLPAAAAPEPQSRAARPCRVWKLVRGDVRTMDTKARATPVRRPPPEHPEPDRARAAAEMPAALPIVEDRVRWSLGDAHDYEMPEGDQPALYRLAAAARAGGHPRIVLDDGLPILVALPVDLYRDLLSAVRPMAGHQLEDALDGIRDARMA